MSDPIIAALIGLAGLVVLAPLANKFVHFLFEKRSKLHVSVTTSRFDRSSFLDGLLKERFGSIEDWRDPKRSQFLEWTTIDSTIGLLLKNKSKKRINNITVMMGSYGGRGFYQIEKQETEVLRDKAKIPIGDLQPNHTVAVTVWSQRGLGDLWPHEASDLVQVSADELDGVSIEFPVPRYFAEKYVLIPKWVARTWWAVVWFFIVVALAGVSVRWK